MLSFLVLDVVWHDILGLSFCIRTFNARNFTCIFRGKTFGDVCNSLRRQLSSTWHCGVLACSLAFPKIPLRVQLAPRFCEAVAVFDADSKCFAIANCLEELGVRQLCLVLGQIFVLLFDGLFLILELAFAYNVGFDKFILHVLHVGIVFTNALVWFIQLHVVDGELVCILRCLVLRRSVSAICVARPLFKFAFSSVGAAVSCSNLAASCLLPSFASLSFLLVPGESFLELFPFWSGDSFRLSFRRLRLSDLEADLRLGFDLGLDLDSVLGWLQPRLLFFPLRYVIASSVAWRCSASTCCTFTVLFAPLTVTPLRAKAPTASVKALQPSVCELSGLAMHSVMPTVLSGSLPSLVFFV